MQRALLDVQALDLRLDQLAHRREGVPEKRTVDELAAEQHRLDAALVTAESEVGDLTRAQRKADADVEQVRTRKARDEDRLQSGRVGSPSDLASLQHEIESLVRRQAELEDVELEVMEKLESAAARVSELKARQIEVGTRLAEAERSLTQAYGEIDAETEKVRAERTALAPGIDEPLMTLYERLRAQKGGIGAARLMHRRCEGCRMELDATFLQAVRAAAPDAVMRCDECARILVRIPESGL